MKILFLKMLSQTTDKIKAKELSNILQKLMRDGQKGKVLKEHFLELDKIDENVDFYILGLKTKFFKAVCEIYFQKKICRYIMEHFKISAGIKNSRWT